MQHPPPHLSINSWWVSGGPLILFLILTLASEGPGIDSPLAKKNRVPAVQHHLDGQMPDAAGATPSPSNLLNLLIWSIGGVVNKLNGKRQSMTGL